ncbi:hypothetical protein LEP1GSC062_4455 [Leptospira alexanderi serovar Manhao 3 str. L 60]|uniref:Uncharacterized protein n=1 Tax=Leptospira alexanderi serovar Manhao 3 str. L 60 TaxID=1049759 RepID=V6I9C8_9LEPT|nr:hypothetical protein LEP1GSC062_4455 [Leptospira alexanderi serovar Manhao 3 str. L 60]
MEKNRTLFLNAEIKTKLPNPSIYKIDPNDANLNRFNRSCILSKKELSSTKVYTVLVTFRKSIFGSEGDQRIFTFIRTKKGFRFCEYLSVP